MKTKRPAPQNAAFLIIGNEILSGRTVDSNLAVLARKLRAWGIPLATSRIVRDIESEIITALDELRAAYDMVFTSGGIGPTHDDITTACIAKAFGVEVVRSAEAEAALRALYKKSGREASATRLRMADVPAGSDLIKCEASAAPGFRIENVHVLAGVPFIFTSMVDAVLAAIEPAAALQSKTAEVFVGESEVAELLSAAQDQYPQVDIGSYPQLKNGKYSAELVVSGQELQVEQAYAALAAALDKSQVPWQEKQSE